MIFVTVGGQIAFDRLVRSVDEWAGERARTDVFAQIGCTPFCPQNLEWAEFLEPDELRRKIDEASAVIAHAGMGTILTALELGKPILVLPRREHLRETRTDHQLDTARHLQERGYVQAAFDEADLWSHLDKITSVEPQVRIGSSASPELIAVISEFIRG